MEVNRPNAARTVSFAVLFTSLVVTAGMLSTLLVTALTRAEATEDAQVRHMLLIVAWVALVLLAGNMVLMLWGAARMLSRRYGWPEKRPPPTPHVDAWAESGRRFHVEDEEDQEDEEDDEDRPHSDGG